MAGLQVLHVDDEPDMRLLVKLSLDLDSGIRTRSAASGPEALDATSEWKPDVILLDAMMPGMDGLATLRALQANPKTAGIPVLFLTGKCDASAVEGLKASGSAGVIAKPFDPLALAAAVRGYVTADATSSLDAPTASAATLADFAGRSQTAAGGAAASPQATLPFGGAVGAVSVGAPTEALLLDASGNAFALTITERPGVVAGPMMTHQIGGSFDRAAPEYAVHVEPLDRHSLTDLLGMDAAALLSGDAHAPLAAAAAFQPVGTASGCGVWSGAVDVVTHTPMDGMVVPQNFTSAGSATDWLAAHTPLGYKH